MKILPVLLLSFFMGLLSLAQTPTLVQDIGNIASLELRSNDAEVGFEQLNGAVIFRGRDDAHGQELWRGDGTLAGSQRIKDITPGPDDTFFSRFYKIGNTVYFVAGPPNVTKLWKTDGTEAGTQVEASFPNFIIPANLIKVGNKLFMSSTSELWVSDGTTAGTQVLKTFNFPSSLGGVFMPTANKLFFIADVAAGTGTELWASDGSVAGTQLVKDITPGNASTEFFGNTWAAVGNTLFFSFGPNLALWKSNGTAAGTVLVKETNPGGISGATQLRVAGSTLFFSANGPNTGNELWRSDGTTAGTFLLKDAQAGADGSYFADFIPYLGKLLYFRQAQPSNSNVELWQSDGTATGTVLIKNLGINPEANFIGELNSKVYFNLKAFFGAATATLHSTNATNAGTLNLGSLGFSAFNLNSVRTGATQVLNGKLFYTAGKSTISAFMPAYTDGTLAGTKVMAYAPPSSDIAGKPFYGKAIAAGKSLFYAFDPADNSQDLWATDGTNQTKLLDGANDVDDCCGEGRTTTFTQMGNDFYFFMKTNTDIVLWKSNGTVAGTVQLKQFSNTTSTLFFTPTAYKNKFYFTADRRIWRTDGTVNGTEVFFDPTTLGFTSDAYPSSCAAAGDSLYISLAHGGSSHFARVYRSDGVNVPVLHRDFGYLGFSCGGGASVESINNQLVYTYNTCMAGGPGFPGNSSNHVGGNQFVEGAPITQRGSKAILNGSLYYVRNNNLVRANATSVTDLNPAVTPFTEYNPILSVLQSKGNLMQVGAVVVFPGSTTAGNVELFKSDGTSAGTALLKEINASGASNPQNFVKKDVNILLFSAFDGTKYAWWKTDGTANGTVKIADFNSTVGNPNIQQAWVEGNTLFFSANDGAIGQELWKLNLGGTPPTTCVGNLLQNPDFESDFTNWEGTGGQIGTAPDVAAGAKSLKLCANGNAMRQTLLASAGKTYSLSWKIKTAGVGQNILIGLKFLSATWQVLGEQYMSFDSPGTFGTGTISKLAPAGTVRVEVSFNKQNAGCIYVDEVCLTENGGGTNPCSPDVTIPVIAGCPANIAKTIVAPNTTTTATWTAPTATDNCAGTVTLTSTHQSGATFPIGTTNVVYTAKDVANNSATCAFTVTVTQQGGGNQADISLANLSLPATTIAQNAAFTYIFDLKNTGGAVATGDYSIGAYLSTDNVFSANDVQAGVVNTGNTPIGTIPAVNGGGTIPLAQPVGTYFLILKADLNNTIPESNENNNTLVSTAQITITAGTGGCNPCTYCAAKGDFPWEEWLAGVKVGATNKTSGKSQYSDFTSTNFALVKNTPATVELTSGFSYFTAEMFFKVWIDYNRNGIFEEPGEIFIQKTVAAPPTGTTSNTTSVSATVPIGAQTGATRMRVSMKKGAYATPCETFARGEVEDFTVNIAQNLVAGSERNPNLRVRDVQDFTLFPNPANDAVVIKLEHPEPGGLGYVRPEPGGSGYISPESGGSGYISPESGGSGYISPESGDSGYISPESGDSGYVRPEPGGSGYISPESGDSGYVRPEPGGSGYIRNQLGQIVRHFSLKNMENGVLTIDLSDVGNGIYFVQIEIPGQRAVVKKLVISRIY